MTCLTKDDEQSLSNMKKTIEHLYKADANKMQKTKARLQFNKKNTQNCFLCYAFLVHTVPSKIIGTPCKD